MTQGGKNTPRKVDEEMFWAEDLLATVPQPCKLTTLVGGLTALRPPCGSAAKGLFGISSQTG